MTARKHAGASAQRPAEVSCEGRRGVPPWLIVGLSVTVFAAIVYGPALNMSFIGDDYIFLDRTRTERFGALGSFGNVDFGWYRPWSRELHFWVLQHLAGGRPLAFRLASLGLWFAGLWFYASTLFHLAGRRVALLATLGVASLAFWGTPLLWISGSQDLWMIAFATLALFGFVRGGIWWPLVPYAGALLSKETAAVLPLIAVGYALLVARDRLAMAVRRTLPMAGLTAAWVVWHPVLLHRLQHGEVVPSGDVHPSTAFAVIRSLLSVVNLDQLHQGVDWVAFSPWRTAMSTLVLVAGAVLVLQLPTRADAEAGSPVRGGRLVLFGAWWAAAGWLPLVSSSIGWHAYYGCLGALGAWLVLATVMVKRPRFAIAAVAALGLLRGVSAAAPSWDWGSEWYQRRAGNLLELIHSQLMASHPTLRPHSRVFFGSIPNNIGLIAGQSPAIRVWYGDGTLQAGFYSYYSPRSAQDALGADLFFHFDSTYGLREVHAGPEDMNRALREDPNWEHNHESLAMTFVRQGDPRAGAVEYEKIAQLPRRPDALVYSGVLWNVAGDSARAQWLLDRAAIRMRVPRSDIAEWAARLRRAL